MKNYKLFIFGLAFALSASFLNAHHNIQAEFGSFDSPLSYIEGNVVDIRWGNPHVSVFIEITNGDLPVGETWQIQGHGPDGMGQYGLGADFFNIGSSFRGYVYPNLRGLPVAFPRAVGHQDGQLLSAQRFRDYQDIANGVEMVDGIFIDSQIKSVCVSADRRPRLAGAAAVRKLQEKGLLKEDGTFIGIESTCIDAPASAL
ncbi:MAG: hypothetical protein CBC38_05970 [Gammaproteobacteria bacterium TMED78]|nr:MAG: hypothetical protein CBC38_05970 [Gammaproteobacteria bacterium TMED78]|tara:strand:+ start:985 stop:1587 length:603 start_codon:yes stop_codon:yes gene_type:complete